MKKTASASQKSFFRVEDPRRNEGAAREEKHEKNAEYCLSVDLSEKGLKGALVEEMVEGNYAEDIKEVYEGRQTDKTLNPARKPIERGVRQ